MIHAEGKMAALIRCHNYENILLKVGIEYCRLFFSGHGV